MTNNSTSLDKGISLSGHEWRVIIAASIGNALEWFDLVVYGFFAVVISRLFFPTDNEVVSLLLTFATFAISFLMRPLGAIVIGIYADKAGRKAALTLAILLMMVGTFMIGIMPTYDSIGILAPIGIILARLMQGFSAGGEFGSATAYLAEHSPEHRGFFASWIATSQGATTFLAAVFGVTLTTLLTPEQLSSWGWRIPYFFGLLIGPVAYYIRLHLDETPEFQEAKEAKEVTETPLRDALASQKELLLVAIGAVIFITVSAYLLLYMPTYAVRELHLPASAIFTALIVTGLIQMFGTPFIGMWSDRHGYTPIMLAGAAIALVIAYPAFSLLLRFPSLTSLILFQIAIGIVMIMYYGALPALLTEVFPVQTRTTGMSVAYNLAVTFFGGFAPFIITSLIGLTGSSVAPAFYWMAAAAVSIAALMRVRQIFAGNRRIVG